MSLNRDFFQYLDHFGPTVTVAELNDDPSRRNVIALRHDIDHDLDLALEVAHHEHKLGRRATFFLLHTQHYWNDPRLELKCRQIEAYGHEIGIHINVLTEWLAGQCESVERRLAEIVERLRSAGVNIRGVSAHGDRACYEHGFTNYWIWEELRGIPFGRMTAPGDAPHRASAEGVPVDDPEWQVHAPPNDRITRPDGATFPLWSCSLSRLGLEYDAAHVGFDHYWSDTGGGWTRTGDPLRADLSRGRHQVLMHPVWWRAPKRLHFVLSAARSGSKWLANFVNEATPCRGVHERTLNVVRTDAGFVEDKRTNDDYVGLIESRAPALQRIRDALADYRTWPGDVLEANVYLEPFLAELRSMSPEASFIFLHRDGRDVVRSILTRGWYDTPEDCRHRVPPVEGWAAMSQFERACWYYRHVNETILPHTSLTLSFERMVRDVDYLADRLAALGIVVHPLLAAEEFPRRINANEKQTVPPYEEWPPEHRRTFDEICGPIQRQLGYTDVPPPGVTAASLPRHAPSFGRGETRRLLELDAARDLIPQCSPSRVKVKRGRDSLEIQADAPPSSSSHLLLADGRWTNTARERGLPCETGEYVRGRVRGSLRGERPARLFVLFFDAAGRQVRKQPAAVLRRGPFDASFAFSAALGATHFVLALHLGSRPDTEVLTVNRLEVDAVALDGRYCATRVQMASTGSHGAASPASSRFDDPDALRALYAPPAAGGKRGEP